MAEEAQEVEQNPIHDLVVNSLEKDYNKANKAFGDIMTVKLTDLLDQEKIKLADQIYNGAETGENPEDVEQSQDSEEDIESDIEPETAEDDSGEEPANVSGGDDDEEQEQETEEESSSDAEESMVDGDDNGEEQAERS